jgi:hypothetical protein
LLRSALADQRPLGRVDDYPRHFAITA